MSIFRQLTSGLVFDKKKFRNDAEKFGLIKPKNDTSIEIPNISLDNDIIPDSNMPTPEDSEEESHNEEEENELKILGNISVTDKKKPKKNKQQASKNKTKHDLVKLHQEKINHFRNVHRIHVKGNEDPSVVQFHEFFLTKIMNSNK